MTSFRISQVILAAGGDVHGRKIAVLSCLALEVGKDQKGKIF
jgi:hypothetical protein